MTKKYLPSRATISESCEWLNDRTGEQWTIARLLEYGLVPWFWLDYTPGWPAIFGDKKEGYLAPICFAGDTDRLAANRDVIVTMTRTHDGKYLRIDDPVFRFDIEELLFLREDIKQLADRWAAPSEPAESAAETVAETVAAKAEKRKRGIDATVNAAYAKGVSKTSTYAALAKEQNCTPGAIKAVNLRKNGSRIDLSKE